MVELARIPLESSAIRGPDATWEVPVAREWLLEGASVELTVPTKVRCARCEGGGCDTCGRSGAVLVAADEAERRVVVHLAPGVDDTGRALRLPGLGGKTEGVSEPGDLRVTLLPADAASPALRRVGASPKVAPWMAAVLALIALVLVALWSAR